MTFEYYVGVILFLDENYEKVPFQLLDVKIVIDTEIQAEEHLTEAWNLCHGEAKRNRELEHLA